MKVKLHEVNKPNRNKRIYPEHVFRKAIEKYTKDIEEGKAFVCNYTPENCTAKVDLNAVIGKVTHMEIENHILIAEIEKLNVNNSDEIWPLIEQGKLFVTIAGVGILTEQIDGTYIVGDNYEFIVLTTTAIPS